MFTITFASSPPYLHSYFQSSVLVEAPLMATSLMCRTFFTCPLPWSSTVLVDRVVVVPCMLRYVRPQTYAIYLTSLSSSSCRPPSVSSVSALSDHRHMPYIWLLCHPLLAGLPVFLQSRLKSSFRSLRYRPGCSCRGYDISHWIPRPGVILLDLSQYWVESPPRI